MRPREREPRLHCTIRCPVTRSCTFENKREESVRPAWEARTLQTKESQRTSVGEFPSTCSSRSRQHPPYTFIPPRTLRRTATLDPHLARRLTRDAFLNEPDPVRTRMDSAPPASSGGLLAKRRNRNKKGLALGSESAKPGTLSGTSAASLLAAPLAPPVPSRPPPIQVAGSSRSNRTSINSASEISGLVGGYLTSPAESPLLPTTPSLSSSSSSRSRGLSDRLADLELGVEFKLDLRNEDLQVISELGCGNGGTVSRALHVPTKVVMAKKVSSLLSPELLSCGSWRLT